MGLMPNNPKIYHILPLDKLEAVFRDGYLYSENHLLKANCLVGSNIGILGIKERRRTSIIPCCAGLHVGDCVPFYYCPRSVMLYLIHCGNHPNLEYKEGQGKIVHLEFDMRKVYDWATGDGRRTVITDRNAGTAFFEAWCTFDAISNLDWSAINASDWRCCKDGKQAEFLVEDSVNVNLIERVGVKSKDVKNFVELLFKKYNLVIPVEVRNDWYYGY